ncbi:EcsC family protein [Ureibacillus chungkukjangi]|uniref:EcsC family protein n=1 Tax=Ureibacillus chungkukjangi TaxID=1202712 RepID=A0A318TRT2_9BACL|nr:EcsC family protein [Ureibacillus chungkukjangi]MCM3388439.1 EcsC family protein [Ureibacillus chungkukjangi]PYF07314.1 EcsC family protein [Ureibacillus chungkukjangi]
MESKEQLEHYLVEIEKWEDDQKGLFFWEKIGRLPFKVIDKLTPKFIQAKIGILVNELGSYIHTGGKYLISEKLMLKKIQKNTSYSIDTFEDIGKMPIEDMIQLSEKLQSERSKLATVQGASTGFGGVFTLVIDIPVILGMALKTLQEIAIIHGYNPNEKQERVFIVKCLQFASADIVGKEAILNELSMLNKKKDTAESMISQLKGWQEVFFTYRDNFGWKKLFQMVPIAGMVFGAIINKGMMDDVSEAGKMLYRKRRIYEKLHELEKVKNPTIE